MIDVDTIDANAGLSTVSKYQDGSMRTLYHDSPVTILQILVGCPSDTLRPVQAEQAVIKLSNHIFRSQEVVEEPSFSESVDIRPEDRRSVGSEVTRLVDGDENIFEL
jgi:hypothetical protein